MIINLCVHAPSLETVSGFGLSDLSLDGATNPLIRLLNAGFLRSGLYPASAQCAEGAKFKISSSRA